MEPLKDCDTCYHHHQSIMSQACSDCLSAVGHSSLGLKNWTPKVLEVTEAGLHDAVSSPKHYMLFPDLESIQAIQRLLTPEEYRGFLKGNVLKYRFRAGRKGGDDAKTLQDIQKSEQYAKFLGNGPWGPK